MSESTGTLRVTRQSSCPISILEMSQDGKYIKLSNGSASKEFDLSDWSLDRIHPKGTSSYTFQKGTKVKPQSTIQVWGRVFDDEAPKGALIAECKSWGTGNGELFLKNKDKETKASSSMKYELK